MQDLDVGSELLSSRIQTDSPTEWKIEEYLTRLKSLPVPNSEQVAASSHHIQKRIALLKIREKLIRQLNRKPSLPIWAGAANLAQDELVQVLERGQQAQQMMMETHLSLVISMTQAACAHQDEFLLLIRAGAEGLEQSIETFNPSKGKPFREHALWWIELAVHQCKANEEKNKRALSRSVKRQKDHRTFRKSLQNDLATKKVMNQNQMNIPMNSI